MRFPERRLALRPTAAVDERFSSNHASDSHSYTRPQVTFFRVDHRLLDHMKDGILHVEVWAAQSLEERSVKAAAISRRNQFSFTTPVIPAIRYRYHAAACAQLHRAARDI